MYKDPHEILGVSQSASDEQVKEAYKQLARKYQSDEYNNSPLADLAQKKMSELDEAYDEIMLNRRTANKRSYRGKKNYNSDSAYENNNFRSSYPDIRAKISANRIDDAETLLEGILPDSRDAEWYYLKGLIAQTRGWFEDAERNFAAACGMDTSNFEYAAAYNKVRNDRSGGYRTEYTGRRSRRSKNDCDCCDCDCCCQLMCCDCCCESMGGDCIPCC